MKTTFLPLSDPDLQQGDLDAVAKVLASQSLSSGPVVKQFEREFAVYLSRKHAIAVASGTIGLLLALRARGIGPGDEVIVSAHSFRETAHAIMHVGARPVFADIDYWAGTLAPEKAKAKITERTRAIIAGNANGHPAPWEPLRELAAEPGVMLIEDSTEAIGSIYKGRLVGSFGDCAIFDFSQPGALVCGEGGMIVTDDDDWRRSSGGCAGVAPTSALPSCSAQQVPMQALSQRHRGGARPLAVAPHRRRCWRDASASSAGITSMSSPSRASRTPTPRRRSRKSTGSSMSCISARASRAPRATASSTTCTPRKSALAPIRSRCICNAPISISAIGAATCS